MTLTAEPPKATNQVRFTPETARKAKNLQAIAVRKRKMAEVVADAFAVSKPTNVQEIGLLVRSNMAHSILVQSAILKQQQATKFNHLLGTGRKPGILDVCERLANAAKTVFQWGSDESQAMISIGSFVQINQAPQSPSTCGVEPTASGVPSTEPKRLTPQDSQVIDVNSVVPEQV